MDRRSERRAIKKDGARNKHIDRTISEAVDSPVTVRVQRKTENIDQAPRAHVKRAGNEVEVVLPNANNVPTKKAYRQFAAAILGIFEVAMQEPTLDRRREKFSALLMKLFSEW